VNNVMIIGLDGFIAGLGAAAREAVPIVRKAALNMALEVRRLAGEKAPKRTSVLAQSITATPLAYGAQTTVEAKYGIYVEMGTGLYDPRGAHLIYSKSGGPLAWGDGHFAMWTRGMKAQPFFWPAVREVEPYIIEQMRVAADVLIGMAVKA
jgi:HK97 gp10 family phage protein